MSFRPFFTSHLCSIFSLFLLCHNFYIIPVASTLFFALASKWPCSVPSHHHHHHPPQSPLWLYHYLNLKHSYHCIELQFHPSGWLFTHLPSLTTSSSENLSVAQTDGLVLYHPFFLLKKEHCHCHTQLMTI